MNTPSRIPLLVNPAAGGGRARAVARRVGDLPGVVPQIARDAAELASLVRDELRAGTTRLLVAGGDGSVHVAIQLLAGTACALGIVPAGRGNDLARALGLPLAPLAAAQRAISAEPRSVDLGVAGDRLFAGVASLGLDAEVASLARERGGGKWVYPYALVRALVRFRPPQFRIEHGADLIEGAGMLAAVANSPCYGGGMRIAPTAELADGLLDVVFVRSVSKIRLLSLFPRVYRGTHVSHPAVVVRRAVRVTIRVDRPLTWFADGEPLAAAGPAGTMIGVRPGALRVLA